MPIETAGESLVYYIVAYDGNGNERSDDPDGQMSQRVADALAQQPVTDVFIFSHGWKGDLESAKSQYREWTAAMINRAADLEYMARWRPNFQPMLVGLHWPSLPWGNESFGAASFSVGDPDELVIEAAQRLKDTPATRSALRTLFAAASKDSIPASLSPEVRAAYDIINRETGMGSDGEGAAPGDDREKFDAEEQYQTARSSPQTFGIGGRIGNLLSPLENLSFWQMKNRARSFGEGAANALLNQLLSIRPEAHFHLMGHSFGCIVVSAAVVGRDGSALPRPVNSLVLVQGALSLWSYCTEIALASGRPGYFHNVMESRVNGPIVTTQSEFDLAVGRWYPLAAGVARQVDFAPQFPRYGGVGRFGLQGPGLELVEQNMLPVDGSYEFQRGKVYNLASGAYICHGSGASGAHSDITGPEVAHAVWQAALA